MAIERSEYFCFQHQAIVEDASTHLDLYPDHVLMEVTTTSGVYDVVTTQQGFADVIVAPNEGTSTQVISGFPTIEEAINYIVASGFPAGTTTVTLSGYDTLEDAIEDVQTSKVSISGDVMTGHLTLNAKPVATLHAATKQYVDSEIAAISGSTGSTGTLEYSFSSHNKEGVYHNKTSYKSLAKFLFPGSNSLGSVSTIKAVVKTLRSKTFSGKCSGYIRIYDVTNAKVICEKGYSTTYAHILNLGVLSNIPTEEAVWELQLKSSQNQKKNYCYALSIQM